MINFFLVNVDQKIKVTHLELLLLIYQKFLIALTTHV